MRGKFTGNAVAFPVSRFDSRWVVRRFQFAAASCSGPGVLGVSGWRLM